jgi:hypothetical protein
MEAKPFVRVLVAAALLGAGLGGATTGVQRLATSTPGSTAKTLTTSSSPAQTAAQTQKTGTTSKTSVGTTTSTATAKNATGAAAPVPTSPAASGRSTISGTATAIKDGVIVITKNDGGSLSVTTGTGTAFQKQSLATIADLLAGLTVTVAGVAQSDGSIQATAVTFGNDTANLPAPSQPNQPLPNETRLPSLTGLPTGQPGAGFTRPESTNPPGTAMPPNGGENVGTIQSVSANTLTLRTVSGTTLRVVVGTNTTIQRISSAILTDVVVGAGLKITGSLLSDGSLQASSVIITSAK